MGAVRSDVSAPRRCPDCDAELGADGFCDVCGYDDPCISEADDDNDDNFDRDELGDDPEED